MFVFKFVNAGANITFITKDGADGGVEIVVAFAVETGLRIVVLGEWHITANASLVTDERQSLIAVRTDGIAFVRVELATTNNALYTLWVNCIKQFVD